MSVAVAEISASANTETPPSAAILTSDAASILAVIGRMSSNPMVDMDKIERMFGLYERMRAQQAKAAYIAALARMQPEFPEIPERGEIKDRNGRTQSRYALWEDICDGIKPVLGRHGFAISFRTGVDGDKLTVTCILAHCDGHQEHTTIGLPHDMSGNKNAVQGMGSTTSYGKRYTAAAMLNLTSRGEDDDGQSAARKVVIDDVEIAAIRDRIEATGSDEAAFCRHLNIAKLHDLPRDRYDEAVEKLEAKARKKLREESNAGR